MINTENFGNIINGTEEMVGDESIVKSPVDGSPIASVYFADRDAVSKAIDSSYDSYYKVWSKFTLSERKKLLAKLADRIQEKSERYATLESLNTGKTLRQSMLMDIPLGIEHLRYFATETEFKMERQITHPEYPDSHGIVQYVPMGVVGAITPWNVPFLMAVWKAAPALLAGNTVVIKPSSFTPLTTIEMARDAISVGFPPGVLNVVNGRGETVGEELARNKKVRMLSFTGSTYTGKRITEITGIKKVTLELGGKSPNIVFDDADLERAALGVMFGIYLNSGQLCESGSRLLVQSSIKDKFLNLLKSKIEKMRPGNPMSMETDISAITTKNQRDKIEKMVNSGLKDGSVIFYQKSIDGSVPKGGLYFPPTILDKVSEDMEVAKEEIFGPVLSVMEFDDEADAIDKANMTDYGLAAGVWTQDSEKATRVASSIEAGTVWINEYHLLSAAAPRGGFKNSGVGRELGLDGIMEFTQTRHLFVSHGSTDQDTVAYGLVLADLS
ncbi:betaine aldehyde dehydrogenase [Thermoplasma volcanium GSS1]|uniref:Betaine aldehyde dehydrogenase n=1 Tax=Thermoplasma volcanium (strain ATCC 51530 / DSM 4299 / JCM 9571 / NBRC 15438 / GSS1) TaxID=273116 RepID=Q97BQ6_THEVO|nr:aldehyde dehydrogenase family protein [Thermoplasma volcanium]BAB59541.1 betaine aldehyde dehydrogenase [Thermoplasma volcanium GSS1]